MSIMTLDDLNAMREIDRSDMLSLMGQAGDRLRPPLDASETCPPLRKPSNVVFGGVGGSGIAADIIVDLSRDTVEVPVSVCRSPVIPKFVSHQTLFVAVSYSGETEETLSMVSQAKERDAEIAVIASGGRLLREALRSKLAHLTLPTGMLPRVALPELVAAVAYVMGACGLSEEVSRVLAETGPDVRHEITTIGPTVPTQANPAKQMAMAVSGRLPLLIGNEEDASVLRRFKNELNENSKVPAFCYTLPESYHDDIEGLRALRELANVQPIILRSPKETESQSRTRRQLVALFEDLEFPDPLEFQGRGSGRLSQLMTAITFGDFVSVYLSLLRRVDPSEMRLIPKFRATMRAST